MKKIALFFLPLLLLSQSCSVDTYETGDGDLSFLRADFVEVKTSDSCLVASAVTDDNETIVFSTPYKCQWATKKDSVYRALLYYQKKADGTDPVSISSVPVLRYTMMSDTIKVHTDPVIFESSWISKNGKYLNLGIALKTGQVEGLDNQQVIGLICDSIVARHTGKKDIYLRFYHNQNKVPEYYSSRLFVSMPVDDMMQGQTVHLSIQTYKGLVEKVFDCP